MREIEIKCVPLPPHRCYSPSPMPLSPEEMKRRIIAAAALNGWRLNDLPEKLEEFGAQKHLAAGLADGRLQPRPALLNTLANFFEIPEKWFTEEDWRSIVREE